MSIPVSAEISLDKEPDKAGSLDSPGLIIWMQGLSGDRQQQGKGFKK